MTGAINSDPQCTRHCKRHCQYIEKNKKTRNACNAARYFSVRIVFLILYKHTEYDVSYFHSKFHCLQMSLQNGYFVNFIPR